ncbi:MAG: 50S ribosomal protein L25/general stress protein Ctc [Chlamydiales bacterium]
MKLSVTPRVVEKKRESKRLRRDGKIPAVIYGKALENATISIDEKAFCDAMRSIPKGRLATTRFNLTGESGNPREAIVKDIQYHPTTYKILHLDFEELQPDVKVNINVPIVFTGVVDCVGIKLGGVLRPVIRSLRVSCYPKDIPAYFELNVKNLKLKQYLRLSDISIPEEVRPLADLNEVAVVIAKR